MRAIDLVLSKVFVRRFYSENASFFLVLLGVCFGFLKAPQHYELSRALADKPIFYLIPIGLWILYALKVARFCSKVNREKESIMLGSIELVGRAKLFWLTAKLQIKLYFPVWAYGLFMAYVALKDQEAFSAVIVVVSLAILLLALCLWQTRSFLLPKEFGLITQRARFSWKPASLYQFYIHQLLNFQGIRWILIKLISFLILYIAIQVFLEEAIDFRYLSLGVLLSATANSFFSLDYVEFERSQLQLFRNLPIGFLKRITSFWFTFLILSIPEFLVLVGQLSLIVNWFDLISLMFFIPSLLILFMAVAYQPNFNQERFTKQVFILTATLFFVILGYVLVLALVVLALIVSVLMLKVWMRESEVI